MTDTALNDEVSAQARPDVSPGGLLAAAREERGLSTDQVADALRYSSRQIAALEADDYGALPGATVIRGMVRAYAKHLGIDPAPILERLRTHVLAAPPKLSSREMAVPFPGGQGGGHRFYVIGSIVLALLAAALLANWNPAVQALLPGSSAPSGATPAEEPRQAAASTAAESIATAPSGAATPGDPAAGDAVAAVVTSSVAAGARSTGTTASQPGLPIQPSIAHGSSVPGGSTVQPAPKAQAPAAPRPAGHKRIELTFEGESWVQIRSGSGEILMNDLNPSATQRVVTGQPPFQVVIGAANGVRMRYENAPFNLVPHTRDDVARMTLE